MQSLTRNLEILASRVSSLEQKLSCEPTNDAPQPPPATPPTPSPNIIDTLESIRKERINALMTDFETSKPEPTPDNFFEFVDYAIIFVKRNIRMLQNMYNPGAIALEAGKFIIELVIILVTTNFLGNPVLASIEFIQRTAALIMATHEAVTINNTAPVAEITPPPSSGSRKRAFLSIHRRLANRNA